MNRFTKFLILTLIGAVIIFLALVVTGCDLDGFRCTSPGKDWSYAKRTNELIEVYGCKNGEPFYYQTNVTRLP